MNVVRHEREQCRSSKAPSSRSSASRHSRWLLCAACLLLAASCSQYGRVADRHWEDGCLLASLHHEGRRPTLPQVDVVTQRILLLGAVHDRGSGTAEAGALLEILDSANTVLATSTTDSLGGFAWRELPPGARTLRVFRGAHRAEIQPINVQIGRVDTVRVSLQAVLECR